MTLLRVDLELDLDYTTSRDSFHLASKVVCVCVFWKRYKPYNITYMVKDPIL